MKIDFRAATRRVLKSARHWSVKLKHRYVGPEHMLLGLLVPRDRVVEWLLGELGVTPGELRKRLLASVEPGTGPEMRLGELPFTSLGKKVLEYTMAEARELGDHPVGTEHLFLGLLREEKSAAARTMKAMGATLEEARAHVRRMRDSQVEEAVKPETVWFLQVDADADTPIYEQIIARIEEAVATGRLDEEERLPPIRQLAEELGIAPGTVARAYSALEERGVLITEGAKGTRVAPRPSSTAAADERAETLEGLLRPVVVAAYHLGATADQIRKALDRAMKGIFGLLA